MHHVDREIFQLGPRTREQGCPLVAVRALLPAGIAGAGLSDAAAGYRMARPGHSHAHLLVCHGGGGRVLVDGAWLACGEGQAYVSPARRPMAFEVVRGRRWRFAWVYFEADQVTPPGLLAGDRSTLLHADPRQLPLAIRGLYHEAVGLGRPALLQQWAALVHAYAADVVCQPRLAPSADTLWRLWADVDARPAEPWDVGRLAARAGMSAESLRTRCLRECGRSPMRQVALLRLRRAHTLLRSSPAKLAVIARTVGYRNVFAFSTAFQRQYGAPPSGLRGKP